MSCNRQEPGTISAPSSAATAFSFYFYFGA